MLSFYTIVIIIAIVILVIALTIIGITLVNKKNNIAFPDYQNTCPDFWTLDSSEQCVSNGINVPLSNKFTESTTHKGVKKSDTSNTNLSINLSEENWVSICDKASWGKKYGILWDGVTNNNTCV